MNNIKSLRRFGVALPVASFVALAGTGFGVWIFATESAASNDGAFAVTNAFHIGNIAIDAVDNSITLDQTNSDFTLKYKTTVKVEEALGGHRDVTTAGTSYKDWQDNTAATVNLNMTYNFGVDISDGLETYIGLETIIRGASSSVINNTDTVVRYDGVANNASEVEEYTIQFGWKTEKKPTTMGDYKAMVKAVKNGKIKLTAKLVDAALAA